MSTDVFISPTDSTPAPAADVSLRPCDAVLDVVGAVDVVASGGIEVTTAQSATENARSFSSYLADCIQLTKPRIVMMILITTIMTAMIGAGGAVPLVQLGWLLLGTGLVAASAGAANQVWERVIDARMTRTALRPLPDGRLDFWTATLFAAFLGVSGTAILYSLFGTAPAMAGAATWLLYVLVYTPMKIRTPWNTTVGAIAGALPVLIGYTAMGGTVWQWTGWLLVGVLVAWQYPHFMSIAWLYRRQYHEAGFRMTTTVEPSGRSAGWQSVIGSLALIACGIVLCFLPGGGLIAWVASLCVMAASLPMLVASWRFAKSPSDLLARRLLRSSLLVLPAVLAIASLRVFV